MATKRKVETAKEIRESDIAQERMGKNKLQGDDQAHVRNQRQAVPDVQPDPDSDILESFDKLDKDKRAKTEARRSSERKG